MEQAATVPLDPDSSDQDDQSPHVPPENQNINDELSYPDNIVLSPSAIWGVPLCLQLGTLNVTLLGLSFFFLFSAFSTIQAFQARLSNEWNAWCLALLNISFAFTSLLAPLLISKVGLKFSIFVGSLGYTAFVLANSGYLWLEQKQTWLLFFGSFCNGAGAAIVWSAQGTFLARWSVSSNLGRNSGIFFGLMQLSGFVGNLVVGLVAGMIFENGIPNANLFMIGITTCSIIANLFFMVLGNPPVPRNEITSPEITTKEFIFNNLLSIWRFLRATNVAKILGPMASFGAVSGIHASVIVKWVAAHDSSLQVSDHSLVGWAMMTYSICLALTSITTGKLGDIYGLDKNVIAGCAISLIPLAVVIFISPERVHEESLSALPYVVSGLLGVGNGLVCTSMYALLGHYTNYTVPAFPLFNFVQAFTSSFFLFTSPWIINYRIPVGLASAFVIFALISYTIFRISEWKKAKDGFQFVVDNREDDESGELDSREVVEDILETDSDSSSSDKDANK